MPLIKARTNRVQIVRHICRLQEPNRDALVLYARFIGDTADYVLNQLIDDHASRRIATSSRGARSSPADAAATAARRRAGGRARAPPSRAR